MKRPNRLPSSIGSSTRALCSSAKQRWESAAEVEAWLAQYRRTKHPRAPRMRAYRCDECRGWHVSKWQNWTSKSKRKGWTW